MKLLPYDAFTATTTASVPELVERVQEYVHAPLWYVVPRGKPIFLGTVTKDGFELKPQLGCMTGRGLELIFRGQFRPGPSGTTVDVRVRHSLPTVICMSIWFTIPALGLLVSAIGALLGHAESLDGIVVFGALVCVGWLYWGSPFWPLARPARRQLEMVLMGESDWPPARGTPEASQDHS